MLEEEKPRSDRVSQITNLRKVRAKIHLHLRIIFKPPRDSPINLNLDSLRINLKGTLRWMSSASNLKEAPCLIICWKMRIR